MKKEFRPFVWNKRSGKLVSSNILQAQQSPKGEEKEMNTIKETSAERFLRSLRTQIRKHFTIFLCGSLIGPGIFLSTGCGRPTDTKAALGKWKRDATYVNGEFSDERRATLVLKARTFRFEEANCTMKGSVAYQKEAMVWGVEQSDCLGVAAPQTIYYGYEVDPADGNLKIFHNNQYNDTIREIYCKVEP